MRPLISALNKNRLLSPSIKQLKSSVGRTHVTRYKANDVLKLIETFLDEL